MFRNTHAPQDGSRDAGFTLIELLVVVVIISVLAAIAIPGYLAQRESAWESEVASDLRNASIAAESYAIDTLGDYAGLDPDELDQYGFNPSANVEIDVVDAASTYTITATSTAFVPARTWTYSSVTGLITE